MQNLCTNARVVLNVNGESQAANGKGNLTTSVLFHLHQSLIIVIFDSENLLYFVYCDFCMCQASCPMNANSAT